MNIHGLKQERKKLLAELREEELKVSSSRLKVLVLKARMKAIGNKIVKMRR